MINTDMNVNRMSVAQVTGETNSSNHEESMTPTYVLNERINIIKPLEDVQSSQEFFAIP